LCRRGPLHKLVPLSHAITSRVGKQLGHGENLSREKEGKQNRAESEHFEGLKALGEIETPQDGKAFVKSDKWNS
jgi:hypothetical protein